MRAALPKRLPLDEMHVVASILDNSQRSLRTVEDFLVERGITTVDILTKYVDTFVDPAQVYRGLKRRFQQGEDVGEQPAWKKEKLHLLLKQSFHPNRPTRNSAI